MLKIQCVGETLCLLPEKAVFWARERALIIADLHLGKPASFRAAGIPVPDGTTESDLNRLGRVTRETGARTLIILGDLFHARTGLHPAMLETFARWRESHPLEIVLVPGNHDRRAGRPPDAWAIREVTGGWSWPPFVLQHEPAPADGTYALAGHIHPALRLREKFGPGLRAPCFCFGPRHAVLPAFGSFTGMCNVSPEPGFRYFAIHPLGTEVIEVAPPRSSL